MDLIKKIEAGKMNEAIQGQSELLKDMLELEIEIVTDKNLTPVEAMLERAEDVDADELAEKTFEKAENELESARKFIQANYRDEMQVKEVSKAAMLSARHAYFVSKEAEGFKVLDSEAAEEKVLYIESLLERVNKKFNQDLVIGNSLYEQVSLIGQRLDDLIDSNVSLNKEITQLKQERDVPAVTDRSPVGESVVHTDPITSVPQEENAEIVGVSSSSASK